MVIDLHGNAMSFTADVGVDDDGGGNGSVTFSVIVDGKVRFASPTMHGRDQPMHVSVDLTNAKIMRLVVGDGGDGINFDHADWANAIIVVVSGAGGTPQATSALFDLSEAPRLTVPEPQTQPAIHGARIIGATPGRPFLFLIPATGRGPLTYKADHLPAGLALDPVSGIISGKLTTAGSTDVFLTVSGPTGTINRTLTIVGGVHKLALTPPMGWNSWNVWATNVDQDKVRAAADAMVISGLAAHGYQYVNIDDSWEGDRDIQGQIQGNAKFPYMRVLSDYVHMKGLKLGIYSSPGPKTCAGFTASYQHEEQDAKTYADWGVDYLKYDWCSYGQIAKDQQLSTCEKPYAVMRASSTRLIGTSCTTFVSTAWPMYGSGGNRSAATPGGPTLISTTAGEVSMPSSKRRMVTKNMQDRDTGTTQICWLLARLAGERPTQASSPRMNR